jgi:hypothetical protein
VEVAVTFFKPVDCYHGFFEAIGNEFDDLNGRKDIINADVLDTGSILHRSSCRIKTHLSWICKTSPPTDCIGMAKIAKARGVKPENMCLVLVLQDLIFLAFEMVDKI